MNVNFDGMGISSTHNIEFEGGDNIKKKLKNLFTQQKNYGGCNEK